ncbi:hypothetical protein C2E23DRAFT_462349 [Lenzites betulinus]|nr:hypothetical protein C2E23DRAFT_462349 [Lenzites betulinus]
MRLQGEVRTLAYDPIRVASGAPPRRRERGGRDDATAGSRSAIQDEDPRARSPAQLHAPRLTSQPPDPPSCMERARMKGRRVERRNGDDDGGRQAACPCACAGVRGIGRTRTSHSAAPRTPRSCPSPRPTHGCARAGVVIVSGHGDSGRGCGRDASAGQADSGVAGGRGARGWRLSEKTSSTELSYLTSSNCPCDCLLTMDMDLRAGKVRDELRARERAQASSSEQSADGYSES